MNPVTHDDEGSNQTVAGLKQRTPLVLNPGKTRSNQTVAGLKPHRSGLPGRPDVRSNQTVAGLKH